MNIKLTWEKYKQARVAKKTAIQDKNSQQTKMETSLGEATPNITS